MSSRLRPSSDVELDDDEDNTNTASAPAMPPPAAAAAAASPPPAAAISATPASAARPAPAAAPPSSGGASAGGAAAAAGGSPAERLELEALRAIASQARRDAVDDAERALSHVARGSGGGGGGGRLPHGARSHAARSRASVRAMPAHAPASFSGRDNLLRRRGAGAASAASVSAAAAAAAAVAPSGAAADGPEEVFAENAEAGDDDGGDSGGDESEDSVFDPRDREIYNLKIALASEKASVIEGRIAAAAAERSAAAFAALVGGANAALAAQAAALASDPMPEEALLTAMQLEARRAAFVAENTRATAEARSAITQLRGANEAAIARALLRSVAADEKKAAACDTALRLRLAQRRAYELAVRAAFIWAAVATVLLVAKLWYDSRRA
jgi:hypothetical protein